MVYDDAFESVNVCPRLLLSNKVYWTLFKCRVKYFQQLTMDVYLQLIKAQTIEFGRMDITKCQTLPLLQYLCSQIGQ